jgi:hypothetical protein
LGLPDQLVLGLLVQDQRLEPALGPQVAGLGLLVA